MYHYIDGTSEERVGKSHFFKPLENKMSVKGVLIGLVGKTDESDYNLNSLYLFYNNDSPEQLAVLLKEATGKTINAYTGSLISLVNNPFILRIVHANDVWKALKNVKRMCVVDLPAGNTIKYTEVIEGVSTRILYNGNISGLATYNDPMQKIVEAVLARKKDEPLIRFRYNGGTSPGTIRIIKLKDVSGTGKNAILHGIDMKVAFDPNKKAKDEGIRQFSLSKIDGPGIDFLD